MKSIPRSLTVLLLAVLLITPAFAAEASLTWDDTYQFSKADFTDVEEIRGIMITRVPSTGTVSLGSRIIVAGDVLLPDQLDQLIFYPARNICGDETIACLGLSNGNLLPESEMTFHLGSGKNSPPVAEDSTFETYKNIAAEVPLTFSDPEGDALTITITTQPKRGTVQVNENGTVTYTPNKNKVGHDSFIYTVTDSAGNMSEAATVRIRIKKPSDRETYADMVGDPDELCAVWLRENDIYCGQSISGHLLFQPEAPLTRGEFIAMCVSMTGLREDAISVSTGFSDENDTPEWLRPYVSTALACGYITGTASESGVILGSDTTITQGEAAAIATAIMTLPDSDSASVSTLSPVSRDAHSAAVLTLNQSGIFEVQDSEQPLTHRDAAVLLYRMHLQAQSSENTLLSWAAE